MTQGFTSTADVANIGILFTNDDGDHQCAGSSVLHSEGQPFQITLWVSEAGLDNGMAAGEEFTWLASDSDGESLDVEVVYVNGTSGVYSLNQITFVGDLVVTSSAPANVPGCTDSAADNYNADANVDDGSCTYPPTTATVEFAVDMNGVDQPSADYDNVVVNGSWNGWQGWGNTC